MAPQITHDAHVLANMAAIGPLDCRAAGCEGRPYMPKAQRTDWRTPPALFDKLAAEFGPFDLDPCGHPDSYASQHCREFWTDGGLEKVWHGRVFLNPPYGRGLAQWVEKCGRAVADLGVPRVVALLPARTDTRWFQEHIMHQYANTIARDTECSVWVALVRFLPGRLKFEGAKNAAPFPSVVVVWE